MSLQDNPKPKKSETRAEFCESEAMSLSFFYKMKQLGLGPDELHVPGTAFVRITPEAKAEWRERMTELARSEAAELEHARRVEQRRRAGAAAAASPKHISRRRAGRKS
jgi:hypothetical protein